jgi:hypothetical protein
MRLTKTFSPLMLSEYFTVLIPCKYKNLLQVGQGAELLNTRVPSLFILVEFLTTISVFLDIFLDILVCVSL